MTGASVGTMHDEAPCWPRKGDLRLNRCRYGAFIGAPVDAGSRLDWDWPTRLTTAEASSQEARTWGLCRVRRKPSDASRDGAPAGAHLSPEVPACQGGSTTRRRLALRPLRF